MVLNHQMISGRGGEDAQEAAAGGVNWSGWDSCVWFGWEALQVGPMRVSPSFEGFDGIDFRGTFIGILFCG